MKFAFCHCLIDPLASTHANTQQRDERREHGVQGSAGGEKEAAAGAAERRAVLRLGGDEGRAVIFGLPGLSFFLSRVCLPLPFQHLCLVVFCGEAGG